MAKIISLPGNWNWNGVSCSFQVKIGKMTKIVSLGSHTLEMEVNSSINLTMSWNAQILSHIYSGCIYEDIYQ